jgi:predicted P-loop ATPase
MSEEMPKSRTFKPLPKVSNLWERHLLRTKEGTIKKLMANVVTVLSNAPEWVGSIGWDDFADRIAILKSCPAGEPGTPWSDHHDKLAASWIQTCEWRIDCGHELVSHSIEVVAKRKRFHPLRDRLNALTWDGTQRLDSWTSKYLGAEDSLVHATIGVRWMLGAVARAFVPGCQMDSAIILEGNQGLGKSSALRILSLGFFTDELSDVGSKDASMQLHGNWIVEIAELDAISRADAARVKAFITRRVDKYRPPYGRHVVEQPRQCVFAGSVNHGDYLKDETGGRRFWPVECKLIDFAALARDVEQLWAEAVVRYRNGDSAYIEDAAIAAQVATHTAERYQGDAWDKKIVPWAQVRESVSVAECLEHVGIELSRWSQADANRVAKILKANSFSRKQVREGSIRTWRYFPNATGGVANPGDTQTA